jgi:transcriptional regulator with XRE-family HTH domain
MATWIGARLRRARLDQGVAQGVLAEKVGVSQATISNWEKGKGRPDDKETKRIERVLGRFNRAVQSTKAVPVETGAAEGRAFGDWLRSARETAKLSVHELSMNSGVSQVQIYNLEAGRSANPREATKLRLEKVLQTKVPEDVRTEVAEEQAIVGLGPLTDFDPHDDNDRPTCAGVYVFYDVSERPIYVGKAKDIRSFRDLRG